MRIIIVEDEQRARRGLKSLIQAVSEECEIVADAANGENALELIRNLRPDAVFTDIKMPFLDGIALIKEVRKIDPAVKFVIVSAYEEFEYARQAISLGVTDYLVKPLIMEDVENVMQSLMLQGQKEGREKENLSDRCRDVHPLIKKALQIIEQRYAQKLNQKDLAYELGISPEYLSYLFTKEMGESFVKFLKKYRIDMARTLLLHGNVSREEVPFRVGFSDEKYFCKVFREIQGECVTDYLRVNGGHKEM